MVTLPPIAIVSFEWDVVDLIESIGRFRVHGFFDPSPDGAAREFARLGSDANWQAVREKTPGLRVALAVDDPALKSRLLARYGEDAVVTLLSPAAYVSARATIGHGAIVQRGVTVMPNARIGRAVKLNVNATVHHDASIGDCSTVAPGAQILGNVRVGARVFVGAGAVVRQRCAIGDGAFIGAGAVVVRDVPADATVVGVPASRRLR